MEQYDKNVTVILEFLIAEKFSACCNCVNGNCLLLDDGEEHNCVQLISKYGVYCNYFKNAVLPADKELFADVMKTCNEKHCRICGKVFIPKSKNQRYCTE